MNKIIVDIVNRLAMTIIAIALFDELLLWMRYRQLMSERLIKVFEAQNNDHLYSTVL